MDTCIDGLKRLREKYSAELEQLQLVDPDAARHWREALEDLEMLMKRQPLPHAPDVEREHEASCVDRRGAMR